VNRLRGADGTSSDPAAYSQALKFGLAAALESKGVHRNDVAVASVFSTLSVTASMEQLRDQVLASSAPAPADFNIGDSGARAVFNLSAITGISFNQQRKIDLTAAGAFIPTNLNAKLPLLRLI